jgi:hypothetical protein
MNLPDMTLDIDSEDLSIANPTAYPEVTQQLSENVIFTTVDDMSNWAKMSSLYPLMLARLAASLSLAPCSLPASIWIDSVYFPGCLRDRQI